MIYAAPAKAKPASFQQKSQFGASQWKYIFKLLGLIVVADGKTLKEELDAYQDAMIELAVVIDPKIVMTRKMSFDWFVYHKEELTEIIDSLQYDDVLFEIFANIRNLPHKLDVVTAMVNIAVSDDDYHPMEEKLIKKTILYWNVRGGSVHDDVLDHKTAKASHLTNV